MFNYLIFDVDGTILDTEAAILKSLQHVLASEGKEYQTEELRFALGIPGKETLRRLHVTDVERVHSKWSNTVLAFSKEVQVFKEIEEILTDLFNKHVKMGIVTSKTQQEMKDEFAPFGLNDFFQFTINADDTENHKPYPDPLLACLDGLDASQHDAIYIGDSIYDMQCAKSAGVKFALALWGAKTVEGFESADFILENPKDILTLIENENDE
ncbi:HAD family hydrolase [Ornithinibacillus gellani]|uniref:HAD family hydrolase n=1 Tax=Ornithinibacillus gellani TaxID=2293253 RepID=UPI000F47D539|nr:HAD family hydrolase [Ornithinibacillus gellani]TQS75121.1 HAD family hydrolase [Ornithinibacillus gellani]